MAWGTTRDNVRAFCRLDKWLVVRGENHRAFNGDEAIGCDAQRAMMVESSPTSPLKMIKPKLVLEFQVIMFDAPTQFVQSDKISNIR